MVRLHLQCCLSIYEFISIIIDFFTLTKKTKLFLTADCTSREEWAIIGIDAIDQFFWTVTGYNMQCTLLWRFYPKNMGPISHCYTSVFCYNSIYCPEFSTELSTELSDTMYRRLKSQRQHVPWSSVPRMRGPRSLRWCDVCARGHVVCFYLFTAALKITAGISLWPVDNTGKLTLFYCCFGGCRV